MENAEVFLSLNAEQVFDLARQLPIQEQKVLAESLWQEILASDIPESQKEFVRNSIEKYPELLIEEGDNWEILDSL